MTSSPAMASGVTISAAGAGASGMLTGGSGGSSGLAGLFGALMGGAASGSSSTATSSTSDSAPAGGVNVSGGTQAPAGGIISILLGAAAGKVDITAGSAAQDTTDATSVATDDGTQVQQQLQLGDAPPITVSGSADNVAAFIAQVKQVYQQLVQGGLTVGQMSDSKELAGALTKLGMAPDVAQGVAERIQTMLKVLKDSQGDDATATDDGTQGTLSAMMLAIMAQQTAAATQVTAQAAAGAGAQALTMQISTTDATNATGSNTLTVGAFSGQQSAAMAAWKNANAGDVTRQLLGLGKVDAKAATDTKPLADTATTDATQQVQVAVGKGTDASIGMALPDARNVPQVAPQIDATMSDAAQAATAVTTTAAAVKVNADEQIQAPKGETFYKLQADKHGTETLEAVKPMGEGRDLASYSQQQSAQTQAAQTAATAAAATTAGTAFADRVAQIQEMVDKAQVGQQVAVQMQPLLDQGGGTVRINLHPKDLGQITIELKVADGKVHGSIAASQPEVVEQLARELHSLRHGLADAGLKLGEQGINLMLSGGNQNGQGQGQNGQQAQTGQGFGTNGTKASATVDGTATSETGLATNLSAWVSPDRVLDVNV